MTTELIAVLVVLMLISLLSLLVQCGQWFMHDGLSKRVARLEANQVNQLSQQQVLGIHERLASMEAEMKTQGTSLRSIQEHLLENDS